MNLRMKRPTENQRGEGQKKHNKRRKLREVQKHKEANE